MAIFSNLVITTQGKSALVALATGTGEKLTFTRVSASDKEYEIGQLESLAELENVCQSAEVSSVNIGENGTVVIEAAFENKALSNGYFMRTLGLCAKTGGEEFLFAVAVEQSGGCYMPPFNGKTLGGMLISLAVAVSNTESITIEAGSVAVATMLDIQRLETAISDITPKPNAFSVDVSDWSELAEPFAGCGFSAEIVAEGVTAVDFPDIYFDEASIGVAAGIIAGTDSGKVVLYAGSIPETALSGTYFIRKGV